MAWVSDLEATRGGRSWETVVRIHGGACRLWPRQKGEQGLPLWILPLESGREEGMWREAEEVLSRWALAAGDSLNER